MARRYGIVILCLFLSVGLLGVQWAAGSSKPLKTTAKQKKHAPVKIKRRPGSVSPLRFRIGEGPADR